MSAFTPSRARSCLGVLTPREREIAAYVAAGQANKVIAIELGISLRTAEAHRARIFRKLGVRNVLQLACSVCTLRKTANIDTPPGVTATAYVLAEPAFVPAPNVTAQFVKHKVS